MALCESETTLNQYAEYKDKQKGVFKKDPKKDNICFQSIKSEIVAARYSKNWKDFADCQRSKAYFGKRDDKEREKRVRRYILLADAYDALENIPNDERSGKRFMHNDWNLGPFYSWNHNYLDD